MSLIEKRNSLFPRTSLLTDFFDDERFWNFDFGNKLITKIPSANVKEDEKSFTIELAAPGMTKEDFTIEFINGYLTISNVQEEEQNEEKESYSRREFSYSSFSRSFLVPESVDIEKTDAVYKDGILKLGLPKKTEDSSQNRKAISVK